MKRRKPPVVAELGIRTRARRMGVEPAPWYVRAVGHRTWYFLVPLVAISWVTSKRLEPQAAVIREKMEAEQAESERRRLDTLATARSIQVKISQYRALADTFATRFEQIDSTMVRVDSALAADRQKVEYFAFRLDSLRTEEQLARNQSQRLTDSLAVLRSRIDSLRAELAETREETRRMHERARADRDLTDRILNPDKYRRKNALITSGQLPPSATPRTDGSIPGGEAPAEGQTPAPESKMQPPEEDLPVPGSGGVEP